MANRYRIRIEERSTDNALVGSRGFTVHADDALEKVFAVLLGAAQMFAAVTGWTLINETHRRAAQIGRKRTGRAVCTMCKATGTVMDEERDEVIDCPACAGPTARAEVRRG